MITIKTIWLIAAIVASLVIGGGAGYVASPSDDGRLRLAEEQISRLEQECARRNAYRDADIIHSPGQEF